MFEKSFEKLFANAFMQFTEKFDEKFAELGADIELLQVELVAKNAIIYDLAVDKDSISKCMVSIEADLST